MAAERIRYWWRYLVRLGFAGLFLFASHATLAQDWNRVHKADDAKWAKATGLDPWVVHKLWKMASSAPDEKLDESRIANLDLDGLAGRNELLMATYAGEKNCLTITVFRHLSGDKFNKIWSVQQLPDGTQFCDSPMGSAKADAVEGVVRIRVPRAKNDGSLPYVIYSYEWNGITYRLTGETAGHDE